MCNFKTLICGVPKEHLANHTLSKSNKTIFLAFAAFEKAIKTACINAKLSESGVD